MLHMATIAPVTAEPAQREKITRTGSAIMTGIAPSVIPARPRIQVDIPASCSSFVKYFLKPNVDMVTANADTILMEANAA